MPHKNLATVRVTNIPPGCQRSELLHFFESNKIKPTPCMSLCPSTAATDASLIATVSFPSESDAKKALDLNGRPIRNSNISIEREFMGLTVLAAPENPELEIASIIAVHGLNGHAFGTWACLEEGEANSEVMWLRDFLPNQIKRARIQTYGYNSALMGPSTSVSSVSDFACDLLHRILGDRVHHGDSCRPLLFVCHSLGGIVVKQALVSAHADPNRYSEIGAVTRSVIFLATPHAGSRSANIGSLLSNVAALAFQRPSKQLLETLKLQSPILSQLSDAFRAISATLNIVNFYERRKTPILNSLVVDEFSSRLGVKHEVAIPIDATHRDICRFDAPSNALYLPVLAQIIRCSCISSHEVEHQTSALGTITTTATTSRTSPVSVGHFLVPISPNPNFHGREKELDSIETHLTAQDHRASPSLPIVAVHGLGGIGKTQLVTKYVYERKARKPWASIFWVSARSDEEIDFGFQEIADKLALTQDFKGRVHQKSPQGKLDTNSNLPLRTNSEGVELVKGWMLSPGREDWLLVFDNYDDIRVNIQRCLPARATGSVLITSRDRRVVGSVANSGLALSAMDLMDAKSLFLRIRSCNANSPEDCVSPPESEVLDEILRELQCFPLAIDQAASFIRENSPMTLREYLGYLKPRTIDRERLMRFKEANPRYPESVMTTWEISLQYLEQSQPRASWILQVLGFLNHSHIAEELLTRTTEAMSWMFDLDLNGRRLPADLQHDIRHLKNSVEFRVAIGTLTSLSLIQRNISGPTLHVHPLVHEWIRVRLNANPAQQAKFAVAATTILYQSFPLELAAWLPVYFPTMSAEVHRRIDQISHHLKYVVDNLQDYQSHTVTTPLECFILLEAIYVTGLPNHSIYGFDPSEEFLVGLGRAIKVIIPYLTQSLQSTALFVHKVAVWLRIDPKLRKSLKTPNQIAASLESLGLMTPVDDTMAMFFMLYATVVIDCAEGVADSVKNDEFLNRKVKQPGSPLKRNTQSAADINEQKALHRKTSIRLLDGVFRIFAPIQKMSPLMRWIVFMVELRLLAILSPAEFARREDLRIDLMLSPEALGYLEFDQRVNYLSQLTHLHWDCAWPKNYANIHKLFALAYSEGKAELAREQCQLEAQQDGDAIRRWSRNEYVSSSFGRSGDTLRKGNPKMDLITPLNYFWTITLDVAEAVSNPDLNWRSEGDVRDGRSKLDFPQRKGALKLVSRTKKLYERILDEQGRDHSRTESAFLMHFRNHDVTPTLMIIHMNLEDWPQAEGVIWHALQCDNVLESCARIYPLPWEHRTLSAETQSEPPMEAESADSQVPIPLSLEASGGIDGGQRTDVSIMPSVAPPVGNYGIAALKPNDALTRLQTRLEAAAFERLASNGRNVAQRGMGRATPILERMGIFISCDCLYNARIHEMLHAFIMLCWQRAVISGEEKSELATQLRIITSIPEPAPKCLGRLELIYRLATFYLSKVPRTKIAQFPPDRSWTNSQDDSADSSDGEISEDLEDLSHMGETSGGTEFDWEW